MYTVGLSRKTTITLKSSRCFKELRDDPELKDAFAFMQPFLD